MLFISLIQKTQIFKAFSFTGTGAFIQRGAFIFSTVPQRVRLFKKIRYLCIAPLKTSCIKTRGQFIDGRQYWYFNVCMLNCILDSKREYNVLQFSLLFNVKSKTRNLVMVFDKM